MFFVTWWKFRQHRNCNLNTVYLNVQAGPSVGKGIFYFSMVPLPFFGGKSIYEPSSFEWPIIHLEQDIKPRHMRIDGQLLATRAKNVMPIPKVSSLTMVHRYVQIKYVPSFEYTCPAPK